MNKRKFLSSISLISCLHQTGHTAELYPFKGYRILHADLKEGERWWVGYAMESLGLTGLQFSESLTPYSQLPAISVRVIYINSSKGKARADWLKLPKLTPGVQAWKTSSVFIRNNEVSRTSTEKREFEAGEKQINVLQEMLVKLAVKPSEVQIPMGDVDPQPDQAIVELLLPDEYKIIMIGNPENQPGINGVIKSIQSIFEE